MAAPPSVDTLAQAENFEHYQKQWAHIQASKTPLPKAQQSFVIVTNREFFADSTIFLSDFLPKKPQLRYFLCQTMNEERLVTPLENLQAALPYFAENQDFLVFIHGDGRTFVRVLENSKKLVMLYNVNVIAFDYPSKKMNKNALTNYWLSRKNIENSLPFFHEFLMALRDFKAQLAKTQKISLMAHSLGGYLIERYIKTQPESLLPHFDHLVWMLTAVKARKHATWMDQEKLPTRNYILFNTKDLVLKTAEKIGFTKFLGTQMGKNPSEHSVYIDISAPASIYHTPYDKFQLLRKRTHLFSLFNTLFHGQEVVFVQENVPFFTLQR